MYHPVLFHILYCSTVMTCHAKYLVYNALLYGSVSYKF